ncbi:MAG: hypothetical protein ACRDHF_18695, partial [Tepidiformaceae bacterium]
MHHPQADGAANQHPARHVSGALYSPTTPPREAPRDWRSKYGHKLVSAEEAVARVKPGDTVMMAPYTCTPFTLCNALQE